MKKLAIVGASGRVGQELMALCQAQKLEVVSLGRKELAEKPQGKYEMLIDFSSPLGLRAALKWAQLAKCPVVSGTTGLSEDDLQRLKSASKRIPILWAPNMSLGVAVLKKAMESLRALEGFDFQIEEFHHRHKKDRPSGTALALQKKLKECVGESVPEPVVVRAGGIFGDHKVHAVSEEEWITYEHQALNRRVFASGALRAALWLDKKWKKTRKPGLYAMEDLLNV